MFNDSPAQGGRAHAATQVEFGIPQRRGEGLGGQQDIRPKLYLHYLKTITGYRLRKALR